MAYPGAAPNVHALNGNLILGGDHAHYSGIDHLALKAEQAFATLTSAAVPKATHDTADILESKKCHAGTREHILKRLRDKVNLPSKQNPLTWMHGSAGVGKSAVMYTLCRDLKEKNLLLGSFFFFKQDADRNSAKALVATLAVQFGVAIPELRPLLAECVMKNPMLLSHSIETQFRELLEEPLTKLHKSGKLNPSGSTDHPRAIIIDGLDECKEAKEQEQVIRGLHALGNNVPFPLVIMIASRHEHQIKTVFEDESIAQRTHIEDLNLEKDVDGDIRKYYVDNFARIKRQHVDRNRLDPSWPKDEVIDILVRKASGQFIYAATIIRCIESPRLNPQKQLDSILSGVGPDKDSPFRELDALYKTIFTFVHEDDREQVLIILGVLFFSDRGKPMVRPYNFVHTNPTSVEGYLKPRIIEELLQLEEGTCQRLLVTLESLIGFKGDDEPLQIFHKSLSDFVSDKRRSDEFHIDEGLVQGRILQSYIQHKFWHPHPFLKLTTMPTFEYMFQVANPSKELKESICSVDFMKMKEDVSKRKFEDLLHPGCTWFSVCEQFVRDMAHSRFAGEDKEEVDRTIQASFRELAQVHLLPYTNPDYPEMWALLYMALNAPPYDLEMGLQKTIVDAIPRDQVVEERDEGLRLVRLGSIHGSYQSKYGAPVICQACPTAGYLQDIINEVLPDSKHPTDGDYLPIFLEKLLLRILKANKPTVFLLASKLLRIVLPETELSVPLSFALEDFLSVYGDHEDLSPLNKISVQCYIERVKGANPDTYVRPAPAKPASPIRPGELAPGASGLTTLTYHPVMEVVYNWVFYLFIYVTGL